jgi:23S rRNA (adenine-N6)-dimethyltransferase
LDAAGLSNRVWVVHGDLRHVPLPDRPYRVVSSPPFGLTTALMARLLDDPRAGPYRADLLIQREVAVKRAAEPPTSLRSAAWAPWWAFELGERVPREAFRPVPRVDAAWLTVRRRDPYVLPAWLAPGYAEALRGVWNPPG